MSVCCLGDCAHASNDSHESRGLNEPPLALAGVQLFIVGVAGGTHIGSSLADAALRLGIETVFFDMTEAYRAHPIVRSISWRLAGRRPVRLNRFSNDVIDRCARAKSRSRVLIATGAAPVTPAALRALRAAGVFCVNFSTDDPWNPAHRARWHLRTLQLYDVVFTPRRSNIGDFRGLGCRDVRYLPFGYDENIFSRTEAEHSVPRHDVLFVGGADCDRAEFFARFMRAGLRAALVGAYWDRFPGTSSCHLGTRQPAALRDLTAAAGVNLCLVRRANRDGHVMRSFEIPAAGGFMLAEDTPEHRDIFGAEGRCVLYFSTPDDAAERTRWALAHPQERRRMAAAAHSAITGGANTYRHRLLRMMAAAA